jgi:CRP-like cAMP-binding protein
VDIVENGLIALLSRRDRALLRDISESVDLELGTVLCEPGEPTRHVYFPIDCFISLVAATEGAPALEVGMIGREGMLGAQLVLGVGVMPLHALVQGAGTARRLAAAPFGRALRASSSLQQALNRYVYVLMAQLATSAVCTRFHNVEARLARWLLMTQDRAHSDSFHLTHEFLAHMLGVRRVGITGAASDLQRTGLSAIAGAQSLSWIVPASRRQPAVAMRRTDEPTTGHSCDPAHDENHTARALEQAIVDINHHDVVVALDGGRCSRHIRRCRGGRLNPTKVSIEQRSKVLCQFLL